MGLRGSDTIWYYSYFVAQPARERRNPNPRVSASLPRKPKALNPGGLGAGPQRMGYRIGLGSQQPVGWTAHIEDMRAVGEAIYQSRNHGAVLEQLRPTRERQIRGDNRAGALTPV